MKNNFENEMAVIRELRLMGALRVRVGAIHVVFDDRFHAEPESTSPSPLDGFQEPQMRAEGENGVVGSDHFVGGPDPLDDLPPGIRLYAQAVMP